MLGIIHAIADNKLIFYLKTTIINIDFHLSAGRFVQQYAHFDTAGIPGTQCFDQVAEIAASVRYPKCPR